jgi:hypothetical protein
VAILTQKAGSHFMPIYDIFDVEKNKEEEAPSTPPLSLKRDRFFSSLAARLFFFILLLGDLCWLVFSLFLFSLNGVFSLITFSHYTPFKRAYLSLKRATVCALSLMIALFSPAFGIMIACTYFLMYDKKGIEEVVPASLQDQFKEFFPAD